MFNIAFSYSLAVLFPLCVKEVIKFKKSAVGRWSGMEHFQQAGVGGWGYYSLSQGCAASKAMPHIAHYV